MIARGFNPWKIIRRKCLTLKGSQMDHPFFADSKIHIFDPYRVRENKVIQSRD
jgi:hypothetical protein